MTEPSLPPPHALSVSVQLRRPGPQPAPPPSPPTTLARAHLDDRPAAANFFSVEGNVLLRTFRLQPLKDLDLGVTEPGLVVHVGEGLVGAPHRVGRGRRRQSGPKQVWHTVWRSPRNVSGRRENRLGLAWPVLCMCGQGERRVRRVYEVMRRWWLEGQEKAQKKRKPCAWVFVT